MYVNTNMYICIYIYSYIYAYILSYIYMSMSCEGGLQATQEGYGVPVALDIQGSVRQFGIWTS